LSEDTGEFGIKEVGNCLGRIFLLLVVIGLFVLAMLAPSLGDEKRTDHNPTPTPVLPTATPIPYGSRVI